jgi:hypothetical protein
MIMTMSNTTTTGSNKGSRRSNNNNCGGTDDNYFTQSVISTADTAILSKLSCVEYGYYQDPFLQAMACGARGLNSSSSSTAASASSGGVGRIGRGGCCGGGGSHAGCGRGGSPGADYTIEPIIRRGTHARVKAIERAIDAFLSLTFSPAEKSEGNHTDDDGTNNRHHHQQRQIVILGSGRDTNYLRYMYGDKMKSLEEKEEDATKHQVGGSSNSNVMKDNVRWYEVDHPSVMSQKARDWLPNCLLPHGYTYRYNAVHDHNHDAKNDNDRIDDDASYAINISPPTKININREKVESNSKQQPSPTALANYHLIGHDLRSDPSQLFEKLSRPNHGYDKSCPTLFVLECVLMYLPEGSIRELLRCIAESPCDSIGRSSTTSASTSSSSFVAIAVYDPIPSHDRFGRTMIDNLHKAGITSAVRGEDRGVVDERKNGTSQVLDNDSESKYWHLLLGLEGTRTLSDQLSRLVHSGGFDIAVGCDMMSAYNYGVISDEERRVAARCEMLDELEEFVLLMEHYCFVMGLVFPCTFRNETGLLGHHDYSQSRFCVAERLCSVGVDSLIGYREGHCTSMRSDR